MHPSQPSPSSPATTYPYGAIGGHSGAELGSIQPKKGEFFDRSELPARFRKTPWTEAEIDAVETGGASLCG
jgi:small subunit ribosomal protein YMR-31